MHEVGIVKFVQIQRDHMKVVEDSERIYRPDPLLKVDRLRLTPNGIYGIDRMGREWVDVHHSQHPRTRFRGDNRISLGLSASYDVIRRHFGTHIAVGDAGENIIIESAIGQPEFAAARRYLIRSAQSGTMVELKDVIPAPPCREFSVFCLQVPQCLDDIKAALQFLDNGMRGYYADVVENGGEAFVQAGDIFLVE